MVSAAVLCLPWPLPADATTARPAVKAPEILVGEPRQEIPDWLARWELARVLSYTKRFDEALREYRRVLREKPDLSDARMEMGHVLYILQRHREALEELEKVGLGRLSAPARLLMADILTSYKRYDEAEALYRAHLAKHPTDAGVRLKLADILSWTKRYPAALEEFETLLRDRPQDTQLRRKYAFVLSWSGRHGDAARELKKTLPEE
jgi:tetratricopeptide (TPR) repeat protein